MRVHSSPALPDRRPRGEGGVHTISVEEALFLGERLVVMAPRPGRIHKEYTLPFAEQGVDGDAREIKIQSDFISTREEILSMIWEMEEEIMGGGDSG